MHYINKLKSEKGVTAMETLLTAKEFWMQYAPCFNFELGEKELIAEGLERGFVSEVKREGETFYKVNPDY